MKRGRQIFHLCSILKCYSISFMKITNSTQVRVTMTGQQAGPFPRFQTLPGTIKRRSLELIEQASRLFSSSEKLSREESKASSSSPEKMSKSKSRNTKSRNKSNEQLNKTRSRHSKESLDSNSTLASNSSLGSTDRVFEGVKFSRFAVIWFVEP